MWRKSFIILAKKDVDWIKLIKCCKEYDYKIKHVNEVFSKINLFLINLGIFKS